MFGDAAARGVFGDNSPIEPDEYVSPHTSFCVHGNKMRTWIAPNQATKILQCLEDKILHLSNKKFDWIKKNQDRSVIRDHNYISCYQHSSNSAG